MASTKVQKTTATLENDSGEYDVEQYRVTIPKNLAEALELEQGTEVEWSIESGKKLSLEKSNE